MASMLKVSVRQMKKKRSNKIEIKGPFRNIELVHSEAKNQTQTFWFVCALSTLSSRTQFFNTTKLRTQCDDFPCQQKIHLSPLWNYMKHINANMISSINSLITNSNVVWQTFIKLLIIPI